MATELSYIASIGTITKDGSMIMNKELRKTDKNAQITSTFYEWH
jgi:hypothetical protein